MMLIFSTWLEQLMKDGLNSNPAHLPCRQLHGMDYKLVFVIKYRVHRMDNKLVFVITLRLKLVPIIAANSMY